MKKTLIILFAALLAVSCVGPDDVSLAGVSVASFDSSTARLDVGVENRSSCKLHLRECVMEVDVRGRTALKLYLVEPVVVAGHFSGRVPVALRVQLTDPLAGLAAMGALRGSLDLVSISGEAVVRAGWQRKRIVLDNESLSDILSNFEAGKSTGI